MRGYHRYRWQLAQWKYERRMKARRHYQKFTDEMKQTVRRFIIYGQYSLEQICGWLVTSGIAGDGNEDSTAYTDPAGLSRTG